MYRSQPFLLQLYHYMVRYGWLLVRLVPDFALDQADVSQPTCRMWSLTQFVSGCGALVRFFTAQVKVGVFRAAALEGIYLFLTTVDLCVSCSASKSMLLLFHA